MSTAELKSWQADFDAGRVAWLMDDFQRAEAPLKRALAIDPHYADTSFLLGSTETALDEEDAARRHLVDALHWDALRFRPDPRINEVIRAVANDYGTKIVLVDTAFVMGADPTSTVRPAGAEYLCEHVHFNWGGNCEAARLMTRGCAAALYGKDPGSAGLLAFGDGTAAAAIGYTGHSRKPELLRVDVLTRKPPFTNQLTYVQNEAFMAQQLAAVDKADPRELPEAAKVVETALAQDPENPALAGILEGIRLDQGDLDQALTLARRAESLLPRDFALSADEASILIGLNRLDEAGKILESAGTSGADLDLLAPVLVTYWTRTMRFAEGKRYLTEALARRPADTRLRIVRAGLLRAAGDVDGASQEFRAVLAADPTSEDALEALVSLAVQAGHGDEVAQESLEAADAQPRNQANNLRAVRACEDRGDADGAIRYMLAAEHSGPVTSTFELSLALKFYQQRRGAELMLHLAEALHLSKGEMNQAVTVSIEQLIARMQREFPTP
jgi:tetratricopeptide (TPR) repeat protein